MKKKQRFKSESHNACNEKINKIPLYSNNDKRLQTFNRIKKYPYGYKYLESMQTTLLKYKKWLIFRTTQIKIK